MYGIDYPRRRSPSSHKSLGSLTESMSLLPQLMNNYSAEFYRAPRLRPNVLSTLAMLCLASSALAQTVKPDTKLEQRIAKELLKIVTAKLNQHPEQVIPDLKQTKIEELQNWRIQFGPATIKSPVLDDVEVKRRTSPDMPYFGEVEVHYTRPATRKAMTDGSPEAEKRLDEFFAKPEYVHKIEYVVEMTFDYHDGKWEELPQSPSNRLGSIPMGTVMFQKGPDGKAVAVMLPNE